jgi:hypothetical protein
MTTVRQIRESLVDSIIQEYGINVDATEQITLSNTPMPGETRIYEVHHPNVTSYIIDTPMTRRIACHPHVVGEELDKLSLEAAERTLPIILELSEFERDGQLVFEQILRAAPGYKLHEAAEKQLRGSFRTVYVRPQYTHTSYREHDGMVQRQLRVVYENFLELPKGQDFFLIMQDTVASGRSGEVAIKALLDQCELAGCGIKKWILYGFISSHGLTVLENIAEGHGIPLVAFAMGNLTALCSNNYDMPLYGIDESLWDKKHLISKLGALVDRNTLTEYMREFIPGADQPGDWSARQLKLFTGVGHESGDINGHLVNSARLIKSLMSIGYFADWQKDLAIEELRRIEEQLTSSRTQ